MSLNHYDSLYDLIKDNKMSNKYELFHVLNWFLQLLLVHPASTLFNDFVVIKICSACQHLGYYCAHVSRPVSLACLLTLKIAYSDLVFVVTLVSSCRVMVHASHMTHPRFPTTVTRLYSPPRHDVTSLPTFGRVSTPILKRNSLPLLLAHRFHWLPVH